MKSILFKFKTNLLQSINAFFKLIRLQNLLILVFTQYFARIFIITTPKTVIEILLEPEIFFLSLCTVLIAAAGYIINDYYDIKIDMVNRPNRVVVNKTISRRLAIFLHLFLNILAVSLAYLMLTTNVALFIFGCGLLLWLYSNYLKRKPLWGNICIGFLAFASLFLLGLFYMNDVNNNIASPLTLVGEATLVYKHDMNHILLFAINAFFITVIREIFKDIEDIRGDILHHCRTLPIAIGIKKTKNVTYTIIIGNIVWLIFGFFTTNIWLTIYLIIFAIIPLAIISYKLWHSEKKSDFHSLSITVKILMIVGVSGMVFTKL